MSIDRAGDGGTCSCVWRSARQRIVPTILYTSRIHGHSCHPPSCLDTRDRHLQTMRGPRCRVMAIGAAIRWQAPASSTPSRPRKRRHYAGSQPGRTRITRSTGGNGYVEVDLSTFVVGVTAATLSNRDGDHRVLARAGSQRTDRAGVATGGYAWLRRRHAPIPPTHLTNSAQSRSSAHPKVLFPNHCPAALSRRSVAAGETTTTTTMPNAPTATSTWVSSG